MGLKIALGASLALAAVLTALQGPLAGQAVEFENLQFLAGVEPEQLALIMQATAVSLGVECDHCHDTTAFAADTHAAKRSGRAMMRMVAALGATTFELLETPSCWTCHRGSTLPEVDPPPPDPPNPMPSAPFSQSTAPAGEIYGNVAAYADLPANQLAARMAEFTRALGVGCDHCHLQGDWSSDENILKPLTRVMITMQESLRSEFFEGRDAVSCWTCHRGEAMPQSNLPAALLPEPGVN